MAVAPQGNPQSAGVTATARPWWLVGQAAAALAAGMGVGRFVYTPILPLMHAQAGLSPSLGAGLATSNYVGYLLGALATIAAPALVRARTALRASLVVLTASLALMPATHAGGVWLGLRFVAGVASALVFVIAVSALLAGLRAHAPQLVGWGFGGVGAGIALSGGLGLVLHTAGTWQQAWWSAAGLTVVCSLFSWRLPLPALPAITAASPGDARTGPRAFTALLTSYTLEGIGYIVAGTFLVAAIDQSTSGWIGTGAWVLVGLAAVPSPALWAWLSRTWSRPTLLLVALVVQAVGITLPVLIGGAAAALASAILFGATFLGIGTLALAIGTHLRVARAVAILTTGYSAGQIIGPLAVTPLLHHGYHEALLVSAGVVALAAVAAGVLRRRFPHHLGPLPTRVRTTRINVEFSQHHKETVMTSTETDILTTVLDQWKSAVAAHDPKRVATYFTGDAIFQGLHPYSVGPDSVAAYYDSQPLGLTADYAVLQTRRLADDLVLGYLTVDFGFTDRPTRTVYLSVILRRIGETWLISHYQVSRLGGTDGDPRVHS